MLLVFIFCKNKKRTYNIASSQTYRYVVESKSQSIALISLSSVEKLLKLMNAEAQHDNINPLKIIIRSKCKPCSELGDKIKTLTNEEKNVKVNLLK